MGPKITKRIPKWCPNAAKVPKNMISEQKSHQTPLNVTKVEPKGRQNQPRASKMQPNGCQRGAKWRSQCIKKSMSENGRQNGAQTGYP